MSVHAVRRVGAVAGLGLLASAGIGMVAVATPAVAAPSNDHALHASATTPDAVAPGGSGTFHYAIQNVSGKATDGVLMNVSIPRYVSLPNVTQDKHCKQTGTTKMAVLWSCAFTDQSGKLQPGQTVSADPTYTLAKNTPGPAQDTIGVLVVPLDANGQPTESWKDLSGPNTVKVPIRSTANHYDYKVSAGTAKGAVGDTVTVHASGTNAGPSDFVGGVVDIVAPTGTKLAELPKGCAWKTQGRSVHCEAKDEVVPAGSTQSMDLKFTITDQKIGADGKVSVATTTPGETNKDNNSAPIRITATGGQGGGGGTLPVTGSSTATVAGTGAAVLLAGAALFVVGRRRYRARHR
ncbi:LPXTG cell wall anchor domain-containing protein [Actinocatenispora rupis]|uniref:DUF11 domain-containing protein n=1 Tax=Actinocatenispora rupis TaxID=519421 RepID=A0A8J3J6K4_9ACTN|nr:LPXTG cell wall anchor domain-containing protein [Actinocatenispora rupis]GID10333.1 hypothetical protein Aru02nite_12220 [Actinocatenispora rupis]